MQQGPPRSIKARAGTAKTSIALVLCNIKRKSAACALGRLAKRRWNQQCQADDKAFEKLCSASSCLNTTSSSTSWLMAFIEEYVAKLLTQSRGMETPMTAIRSSAMPELLSRTAGSMIASACCTYYGSWS